MSDNYRTLPLILRDCLPGTMRTSSAFVECTQRGGTLRFSDKINVVTSRNKKTLFVRFGIPKKPWKFVLFFFLTTRRPWDWLNHKPQTPYVLRTTNYQGKRFLKQKIFFLVLPRLKDIRSHKTVYVQMLNFVLFLKFTFLIIPSVKCHTVTVFLLKIIFRSYKIKTCYQTSNWFQN